MANRISVLHEIWLTHSEVGADEVAVLAVMALHASKDGMCFPSQGLLARLLNRSRPWVNKVISHLVEIGIIEKTDRARTDGGRRTSLYRLVGPTKDSDITESPIASIPGSSASPGGDRESHGGNKPCHTGDNVTLAQELKQDTPPASEHDDESISVVQEVSAVATVPVQKIRIAVIPDEGWQPSDEDLIFGLERFGPEVDLQAATEKFVGRCRAKGYRYVDLGAAWRVWLAEDHADMKSGASRFGRGGVGTRASAAQVRFDAWASVARAASVVGVRHAAA